MVHVVSGASGARAQQLMSSGTGAVGDSNVDGTATATVTASIDPFQTLQTMLRRAEGHGSSNSTRNSTVAATEWSVGLPRGDELAATAAAGVVMNLALLRGPSRVDGNGVASTAGTLLPTWVAGLLLDVVAADLAVCKATPAAAATPQLTWSRRRLQYCVGGLWNLTNTHAASRTPVRCPHTTPRAHHPCAVVEAPDSRVLGVMRTRRPCSDCRVRWRRHHVVCTPSRHVSQQRWHDAVGAAGVPLRPGTACQRVEVTSGVKGASEHGHIMCACACGPMARQAHLTPVHPVWRCVVSLLLRAATPQPQLVAYLSPVQRLIRALLKCVTPATAVTAPTTGAMGSTPTGTAAAALAPNPPPRTLAQDASSTPVKPTTAAAAGAGTGAGTGAGAGCAGAALPSRPPMSPPFVSPRRKTHAHLRARRTRLLSTARTPPAHAPPASGLLVPTPPLQAPPPADSTGGRVPARGAATPRTPVVVVAPRAQGTRLQRRLLRQAMAAMREALRGCAAVARASRTGSATLLAALACPDARVAETAATCLLECTFEGTLRRLGLGAKGTGTWVLRPLHTQARATQSHTCIRCRACVVWR